MSKYIGETEKHLRKLFDAAERSGAILLFDEADALFGKRSQVRDSHDRYANLEVSYLLQRMESYRGIAILTTNMQSALDPAFQRRLRFVVHFPFPDGPSRERIWRKVFPAAAPKEALDFAEAWAVECNRRLDSQHRSAGCVSRGRCGNGDRHAPRAGSGAHGVREAGQAALAGRNPGVGMKAVHLDIDRIVADGLPEAQQRQFARSLEEHLRAWARERSRERHCGNTGA